MTMMRVVGECFFWYRLTRVFPDKFHRAVKRLCCVCVLRHRQGSIELHLGGGEERWWISFCHEILCYYWHHHYLSLIWLADVEHVMNRSSSCYVWMCWSCLCWCRLMTALSRQSSTSTPNWVNCTPSSHSWFAAVMCPRAASRRARSVHSYVLCDTANASLVNPAVYEWPQRCGLVISPPYMKEGRNPVVWPWLFKADAQAPPNETNWPAELSPLSKWNCINCVNYPVLLKLFWN